MKKLICFDLDGTLTQYRTPIDDENIKVLDELSKKYKLLIVSAGSADRIYRQLREYPVDIIGNYGMQEARVIDGKLAVIRLESLAPDKEYFYKKAAYLRKKYGYENYRGESVEFHASGMAIIPLLGSNADIEEKLAFDPDRKKRRAMYAEISELFPNHTVFIGGSSSFDFLDKKYNKYNAVMRYASENGYEKEEIVFVGDDFGDGGGDSHIRNGTLDYIEITDYKNLREKLQALF